MWINKAIPLRIASESSLCGGEVVAVENPTAVSLDQGRQGSPEVLNDRSNLSSGVSDECGRNPQFHAPQFVVDGLATDGHLVGPFVVGSPDGVFGSECGGQHEFGDLGKEQLLLVLPLCGVAEELIESFGQEQTFQHDPSRDAHRRRFQKWFKCRGDHD